MKNIRKVILISISSIAVGIVLVISGMFGVLLGIEEIFQDPLSIEIGRFYDQRPRRFIENIAVDSAGNVHYGLSHGAGQGGSVQVYSNEGAFLYRISFPTWTGMFFFYIDAYDVVHVYPVRHRAILSFYNGELVSSRRTVSDSRHVVIIDSFRVHQENSEFIDIYGNVYRVRGSGVRMYDAHGNFLRVIRPTSPIFPQPLSLSLVMIALGLIIGLTALYLYKRHANQEYV